MRAGELILKTFVTTIDLIIALSVVKSNEAADGLKKVFVVITLLNIMGVWL